ncbi:MAG: SPFH domain-containing protein [Actinomycetaceae bacterium]|nr:SPFH domain-containing protein [Actinomycetaceae bacterium]
MGILGAFVGIIALITLLIGGGILYKVRYKIASADQALVITGGNKPMRILPGGGAFIPPTRKWEMFPLSVMTVRSDDQETQTSTIVPIVVRWTAQLRVNAQDGIALEKAVRGFGSSDQKSIMDSLQQTLDGEVRAVVATMTPEDVIVDKSTFATSVMEGVAPRMADLGFELVSLNIAEVADRNDYYRNLAAEDHENQRKKAATLKATADQEIRVSQAKADEAAFAAELNRDLALKERQLDVDLRAADIKAKTDIANADADVAGELRRTERAKEVAANEGAVAVVKAQQDQEAANAQRAAVLTRAETEKQRQEIEAEAEARKSAIDAEAEAEVAAAKAKGEAEAARIRAEGEAAAINKTAEAEADMVRRAGLAEAEIAQAKGEAEAAAIRAKGWAEAEAQLKMAEALAANNGANLEIALAEIRRDTTIQVSTAAVKTMASIGEKATFIDMGSGQGDDSNLLSRVLGSVPGLLKQLDVQNEALNGSTTAETLSSLARAVKGESE